MTIRITTAEPEPRPASTPSPALVPCAECASAGMPYMVDPIPHSKRILVSVRCGTCRHEWELHLTLDTP